MRTFKILTLLILGFAVFGPAAYFGYALFVKPSRVERADRQSRPAATPTPTPDTGEAELKKIGSSGNDPAVTREALTAWISSHPSSPFSGMPNGAWEFLICPSSFSPELLPPEPTTQW